MGYAFGVVGLGLAVGSFVCFAEGSGNLKGMIEGLMKVNFILTDRLEESMPHFQGFFFSFRLFFFHFRLCFLLGFVAPARAKDIS